jgi:hypothetical protein
MDDWTIDGAQIFVHSTLPIVVSTHFEVHLLLPVDFLTTTCWQDRFLLRLDSYQIS